MDANDAIEIVRKLADGVDPFTGERFPPSSPYQNADTVRAVYLALDSHSAHLRTDLFAT